MSKRTVTAPEPRMTAEAFARRAHGRQVDKAGAPYAGHLGRVAARARAHAEHHFEDEEFAALVYATGWLHDVIEDTPTTTDDLRAAGFDARIVAAVERLTKIKGVSYLDGIQAIIDSDNPIAILVKLADNEANLDPRRPGRWKANLPLSLRYAASARMLRRAIRAGTGR